MLHRLVSSRPHHRSLPTVFLGQAILAGTLLLTGCNPIPPSEAQATSGENQENRPVAVDVAIARKGFLQESPEYTGTTQPYREVSLRSQVEGQLLDISVNVGDPVRRGQPVARLDDRLLTAAVVEAQAEVAARQSEVARLQAEVDDARVQSERARLELELANADRTRLDQLFRDGAISAQQAETARTRAATAERVFRSAQNQIRTRQQSVTAAQRRVTAQQALVDQEKSRRSFTVLSAPVDGTVLRRVTEPGNLAQPGSEVLRLGDFTQVKVIVQISELELGTLRGGQTAEVRLDSLPDQTLIGRVTQISPAADPTARLIPVEITLPNPGERIGSGLLARVRFTQTQQSRVVIPDAALEAGQPEEQSPEQNSPTTVFVVQRQGEKATVEQRTVQVGDRADGRVEILSGLQPGDAIVLRSNRPLKPGTPIRPSILSEKPQ